MKNIVIIYDKATIGGGASKIAIQSAIALANSNKYNVFFFAANTEISEELSESKVVVECIYTPLTSENKNKASAFIYGLWNIEAKKRFEAFVKDLDPDNTIVHVHGWTKALSASIFSVTKKYDFPVIITLHDYFSVCPNGGFYNYTTSELCQKRPLSKSCVCCNCDKRSYYQKLWRCLRQYIQNKYVSKNQNLNYIYISNRILDLSKPYIASQNFYYLRNPIELSQEMESDHKKSRKYICVGRVSEEKGVEDFCIAITKAQRTNDIIGQVIGTGPLYENLKGKYHNIEFTGWIDSKKMDVYYREARILVFPSICNEGSPLTIPEAHAFGLPCIVSDCTSAIEMVENNETGLVYKAKDADDLLEKILYSTKDDVIDKFQTNLRSSFVLTEYSYNTHVKNLSCIYEDVFDKRRK